MEWIVHACVTVNGGHAARVCEHPFLAGQWAEEHAGQHVEITCPKCCEILNRSLDAAAREHDAVNHPSHYTSHPSGIECIQITEHMTFCAGNAIKYLWRAGLKGSDTEGTDALAKHVEDLRKAAWYATREADRLQAQITQIALDA